MEPPKSLFRVTPLSCMLSTKEQQDAHELMQLIMNILDDEHSPHVSSGLKGLSTRKILPKPPTTYHRSHPLPILTKQPLPTFVNRTKGDLELVKMNAYQENPFYGLMATTKKCTSCGSEVNPPPDILFCFSISYFFVVNINNCSPSLTIKNSMVSPCLSQRVNQLLMRFVIQLLVNLILLFTFAITVYSL